MPTLQDVADLAGVSKATVSKVLSNTPYFTEETRRKVMVAVEKLDYHVNFAARALSSGKTKIIAVTFPYVFDPIFKDPHVMTILEGIESVLSPAAFNILLATPKLTEHGCDTAYSQLLRSGYLDGVIAIDNVPIASVAAEATRAGLPSVVIGYHPGTSSVRCDDYLGAMQLVEHLLDLSHRHIGIITPPEEHNLAVAERLRGIEAGAQKHQYVLSDFPIAFGDFSIQSGAQATENLLSLHPEITGIIALNDRMAIGAIQYIHNQGRDVPGDISVVGFDNLPITEVFHPPITTIDQHGQQLGSTAAELLIAHMDNPTNSSHVVLPPTFIERASTKKPHG